MTRKETKKAERYEEDLVREVEEDFAARQKERLPYERQWELNMSFLAGNQYCELGPRGDIVEDDKEYFWQRREAFNHIAPVIESRLARLSQVSPVISVHPATDDDADVDAANLSEKLIEYELRRADVKSVVKKVTTWSETCGTGFYKILWKERSGDVIGVLNGEKVYEGDVEILPVSPFEIYPDSLFTEDVKDLKSIIHARVMTAGEVEEKYGVKVKGREINVSGTACYASDGKAKKDGKTLKDAAVVIERYERCSAAFPNGRLVTVANGKLLFSGELPYINGDGKTRVFPFVKQECASSAGRFFGSSVLERLIPVQRAYNAVKNRKHEFLNRLTMGIMTVEDGSVDVDDLAADGLSPGKILVYRQGGKAPEVMKDMTMPDDFKEEEDKLINEFVIVSGVSDVSSSASNARLSSGTALEILVSQDNSRLVVTAEAIRTCYIEIAKHAIRLMAQFMGDVRAVDVPDESGRMRVYYADRNAAESDDVYLEGENELLYTNTQKKDMIFKLYQSGVLNDEEGKLRPAVKEKVLTLLGYKDLDYQKGLSRLQEEKARDENERIKRAGADIEEIDDDAIHIDEHTRYVLGEYKSLSAEARERFYEHIRKHREKIEIATGGSEK